MLIVKKLSLALCALLLILCASNERGEHNVYEIASLHVGHFGDYNDRSLC
jgi:hypothetical protein